VANVKKTIEEVEGVQQVEVRLQDKQAIVTYVSSEVKPEKIQESVNKRGFKAGKPETQQR
jgi:copper chaperone CopZ